MPRVTLVGYYGRRNLGDDLMLAALAEEFTAGREDVSLDVCTAGPLPFALPPRARELNTLSYGGKLSKLSSLLFGDVVVWGGGTCLYEDGPGGVAGLRGIRRLLRICRAARTRFVLLGIGLGTFHTEAGRGLAREILDAADAVYCRDEESRTAADRLLAREKARPAGDPAFLRVPARPAAADPAPESPRTVAFCGASYYAGDADLVERYRGMVADWLAGGVERVLFVPMHQGAGSDHDLHRLLAAGQDAGRCELVDYDSITGAFEQLRRADAAVSFRLHGLAVNDMLGVPCWAVEYSPKIGFYCRKAGERSAARCRALGETISGEDLRRLHAGRADLGAEVDGFVQRESNAAAAAVRDFRDRFLG